MNLAIRFLVCLGVCVSLSASSDASQFIPLGFVDSNTSNNQSSFAAGVDATGQKVVGGSYLNGEGVAFVWQQSTGMQSLESSNGAIWASAITPDGQTISGRAHSATGDASFVTNTTQGFTPINNAAPGSLAGASAVSADGKVVVGWSPTANNIYEPYRWTQQAGRQFLTDLQGGHTAGIASGISPDGSVIVGEMGTIFSPQAFRWTQAEGFVPLGDLPGGSFLSRAYGASNNGQVIVGLGSTDTGREAFRWDPISGMVGLGFLPSRPQESFALAVTPDGSAIVGGSGDLGGANSSAFVWDALHGMRSLQALLSADANLIGNLSGWNLYNSTAISANGRAIVGNGTNPQGKNEAFLVLLDEPLGAPEPSSLAMCIAMCVVPLMAARQRRALHRKASAWCSYRRAMPIPRAVYSVP